MPAKVGIFLVDHKINTLSALFYSTYRALCCTCSAAYTCILIDLVFSVAFRNSAYRALSCACSA